MLRMHLPYRISMHLIFQRDLLARMKKAGIREEFENRNRGRFIRIFPSDDRARQERYIHLLELAYTTFMSGRASSMHKEIQLVYNNKLRVGFMHSDFTSLK